MTYTFFSDQKYCLREKTSAVPVSMKQFFAHGSILNDSACTVSAFDPECFLESDFPPQEIIEGELTVKAA